MTNLTKYQRNNIRRRAVDDKFDPLFKAMERKENDLAMAVREHLYGPHLKAVDEFDAAHPGWLRYASGMQVNVGGWHVPLIFIERQTMQQNPGGYSHSPVLTINDDNLRDKIRAHLAEKEELETDRRKAERSIEVMLAGFRSTKQLREGWPEGKEYWEPVIGLDDKKPSLPTVQISTVNSILGLPKETT